MKKNLNELQKYGFTVFRKVFSKEDYFPLKCFLLESFIKFGGNKFKKYNYNTFLKEPSFHRDAINLRKRNKVIFGKIYDIIQNSTAIQKFYTSKKIINIFKKINCPINKSFLYPLVLRIDVPLDERNNLDWHQDSEHENINHLYNGYNLWAPLQNTNQKNGSLILCSQSFKTRYKKNTTKRNPRDKTSSIDVSIPKKILDKFEKKQFEVNLGDVLIFNMNSIHKSGENISKNIRFTALGRIYNIQNKTFIGGKTIYIRS